MNPDDRDVPQLRRLQDWWLQLPLSYRLNALLYFLGACFLLFLLTSLLRGGDEPRQIQVGAGNPATTTTSTRPAATAPTSTTIPGSTSSTGPTTTGAGGTTTTRGQSSGTTAGGSGSGGAGGGGSGGSGGGGGASTTAAPTATSAPGPTLGTTPPPTAATTTTRPCRNSTDPACGQFSWSPAPNNQRLSIASEVAPDSPRVGGMVTFRITVTDPDHAIGTCALMKFGDQVSQGSCPDPPCPARYGQWDLPAPSGGSGSFTFVFTHTYTRAEPFIAEFSVDTRSDCWDPYGERDTRNIPIVVGP